MSVAIAVDRPGPRCAGTGTACTPRASGSGPPQSDGGVQCLSIRYTERLAEAGIESSAGSVGDAYDNALAETIIWLYKTEVIEQLRPWPNAIAVELETLSWG